MTTTDQRYEEIRTLLQRACASGVGFIMDWGDTNCTMEKILSFVAVPPK